MGELIITIRMLLAVAIGVSFGAWMDNVVSSNIPILFLGLMIMTLILEWKVWKI